MQKPLRFYCNELWIKCGPVLAAIDSTQFIGNFHLANACVEHEQ
jgi:hypothetical protein